jgi:hypothetical protein
MRRALEGGYGLQYNKLAVEPQRWLQSIPGMWGIADVTHYRVLDRWPRSTFYINGLNNVTLYCDSEVTMCFSWGWHYSDYAYIPEYYWEKSIDNGLTWVPVQQTQHDLTRTTMRIGNHNDSATHQLDGYIDDFRLSIGTGRYLHNFTLPPQQTTDGQTQLLLNFNGEHGDLFFPDNSGNNIIVNRVVNFAWWSGFNFPNAAIISTIRKKYGSGSLALEYNADLGLIDYITVTDARIAPRKEDFCVEMWFYLNTYNKNFETAQYGWGNYQIWSPLYESRDPANYNSPVGFFMGVKNTGEIEVHFNGLVILRSPKVDIEKWNHVAVRRVGLAWCLYLNGSAVSCYNGFFSCIYLDNLLVGLPDTLYRCRLTLGLRSAYTNTVTLAIRQATIFFNQNTPLVANAAIGSYVDLGISAYVQESPGRPLTYQWEVNIDITQPNVPWTVLPGRTAPNLSIGPITADSNNQAYRCRVTCGTTTAYSNITVIDVIGV